MLGFVICFSSIFWWMISSRSLCSVDVSHLVFLFLTTCGLTGSSICHHNLDILKAVLSIISAAHPPSTPYSHVMLPSRKRTNALRAIRRDFCNVFHGELMWV